jgi:predicted amidohydrolase YtcJ
MRQQGGIHRVAQSGLHAFPVSPHADLIISTRGGGTIHTMDPHHPNPHAVAIGSGRILAVGSLDDVATLARPQTRHLALEGRTLLPGFNDAHIHIWKKGHLLTTMLDLSGVQTIQELRHKVAKRLETLEPGRWLLGRGYNEALLQEGRKPTRHDLDDLTPHHPVLLTRTCAHIHTANTRALERSGVTRDTTPPPGGELERDANGELTGVLLETAFGLVQRHVPAPSQADYETMILAGERHLLELGVTSATDPAVDAPLYAAYRALDARGVLPLRTNLLYIRRPDGGTQTLPLPEKFVSDTLRCDSVKFFGDGGLSGATAKISEPYRNTEAPTTGVLRFDTEELHALMLEAHTAGFRIGTHAIGDVTIEQVLGIYERLEQQRPSGLRHRLEHFGLPTPELLRRAGALGVIAVPQAIFIRELGMNFRRYLPERFLPRCYPLRAMLDAGVTIALSSDGPVVRDLRPLAGIHAAVTRAEASGEALSPSQAVGVEEALYAYTIGGALAQGDAVNRGSLTPGKWADLVVLSDDPARVAPDALLDLQVDLTFVSGEARFTRS